PKNNHFLGQTIKIPDTFTYRGFLFKKRLFRQPLYFIRMFFLALIKHIPHEKNKPYPDSKRHILWPFHLRSLGSTDHSQFATPCSGEGFLVGSAFSPCRHHEIPESAARCKKTVYAFRRSLYLV